MSLLDQIKQFLNPDPKQAAVQEALKRYPWLAKLNAPVKLTEGTGPYMDESYMPQQGNNPAPGNYTVQLRDPGLKADPSRWPEALGREGIDWMARVDPKYQAAAQHFLRSLTPKQQQLVQNRYNKDVPAKEKAGFSLQDFMNEAENQEFLGGYVMDDPGWKNAGWSLPQRQLLDALKDYLWKTKP